jgi:hypothetical protein
MFLQLGHVHAGCLNISTHKGMYEWRRRSTTLMKGNMTSIIQGLSKPIVGNFDRRFAHILSGKQCQPVSSSTVGFRVWV